MQRWDSENPHVSHRLVGSPECNVLNEILAHLEVLSELPYLGQCDGTRPTGVGAPRSRGRWVQSWAPVALLPQPTQLHVTVRFVGASVELEPGAFGADAASQNVVVVYFTGSSHLIATYVSIFLIPRRCIA